jgi:hypothetical protein
VYPSYTIETLGKITKKQFNSLLNNAGYILSYEQTGKLEKTEEELQEEANLELEELKKQGRW